MGRLTRGLEGNMQSSAHRHRLLGDARHELRVRTLYAAGPGDPPVAADPVRAARQLAWKIERATHLRRWELAKRLTADGVRLAPHSPRLAESIVRLFLAQGRSADALQMAESIANPTASIRLLRTICLMQTGGKARAHLELQEWARETTAPLQARLMLAVLDYQAGDLQSAAEALLQNLRYIEDPHSLALLLVISREAGLPDRVNHLARRLRAASHTTIDPAAIDLLLASLNIPADEESRQPTEVHVTALAVELLANEHLLPLLVHLNRAVPHQPSAALVFKALQLVLAELTDQASALEALARLALQLGNLREASAFAGRALAASPMSAAVALLNQQIQHAMDSLAGAQHVPDGPKAHAAA